MQQADSAHSATGTLASPGNIENHSATRRGILTAFATLPAVALAGSATISASSPAFAPSRMSPVMAAIAAHNAAEERFCKLPDDLERTNPSMFEREEDRLHSAWEFLRAAEPTTWGEFIAQIDVLTTTGACGLDESDVANLLRRARRLERGA